MKKNIIKSLFKSLALGICAVMFVATLSNHGILAHATALDNVITQQSYNDLPTQAKDYISVSDLQKSIGQLNTMADDMYNNIQEKNQLCKDIIYSFKSKKGISKKRLRIFYRNEKTLALQTLNMNELTQRLLDLNQNIDNISIEIGKLDAQRASELKNKKKLSMDYDQEIYNRLYSIYKMSDDKIGLLKQISTVLDNLAALLP